MQKKIQIIETAETVKNICSVGTYYIKCALESYGHEVDVFTTPQVGYDYELVALHHVSGFAKVIEMPKKSKIRIIGGHAFYTNPRPMIPFSDYLCIGEWDTGLFDLDSIGDMAHVIVSKKWESCNKLPPPRIENPLPELIPYLNYEGTGSMAYYIEIARGCPFHCQYCELGNSVPYRRRSFDEIKDAIGKCDLSKTKKINLFAPDEASHPDYDKILKYIREVSGYPAGFASMRVDTSQKLKHIRQNTLIRCGVDGMSEAIRFRVGKKISDKMILQYFQRNIEAGHSQFKIFMIFGYEWESLSDFDSFKKLFSHILKIKTKKNLMLRIKWTPFIPQPNTPLSESKSVYDVKMVAQIEKWHLLNARPVSGKGFFVSNDGIMGAKAHKLQCDLAKAGEDYFL